MTDRLKTRHKAAPEGQGETVARVFPTPRWIVPETGNQKFRLGADGRKTRALKSLVLPGGQVPGGADHIEDFVIQLDEAQVFPKTFRVIGRRRHQVLLRPESQA